MSKSSSCSNLTFRDINHTGPSMSRRDAYQSRAWVRKEAAKHTTPGSIRRRIAHEKEQIRILTGTGLGGGTDTALEAHHELIRVLSENLEKMQR